MPVSSNYPKITNLIQIDKLPDELHFIHQGLSTFLDAIYYKNLIVKSSYDSTTYSIYLELIVDKNIDAEVPNEENSDKFKLLFNPDYSSSASTIPLFLKFSWGILKYINDFNLSSFTSSPEEIFNLIFQVIYVPDEKLIKAAADNIVGGTTPYATIVSDINTEYGTAINLPANYTESQAIASIIAGISTITPSEEVSSVFFDLYVLDASSVSESLNNINKLFSKGIIDNVVNLLLDLIIPKIHVRVELSAALEIPRKVLIPMKEASTSTPSKPVYEIEPDITKKVRLGFSVGEIYFNSEDGRIGFDDNITLGFTPPYTRGQIANTPFAIGFTGASLSILPTNGSGSNTKYRTIIRIESAVISLPKIFQDASTGSNSNPAIIGTNLVIDSENQFSGTIGIDGNGNLQYTFANNLTIELESFDVTFTDGSVTDSTIHGRLTIPNTQNSPLDIEINLIDGFQVNVLVPSGNGIEIIDNNNILITLDGLMLGEEDTVWRIGFALDILIKRNLPLIKNLFPKEFTINNFLFKSDGSQLDFDIKIEWQNGSVIQGNQNTGLIAKFPVNVSVAEGLIKLDAIEITVKKDDNDKSVIADIALLGVGFKLGTISGSVDGFGAEVKVKRSDTNNGNIGPFEVDFGFIGPRGIGVNIESKVLSGGGYLYIGDHRYVGALSLTFRETISINAIGLLETRLPGNQPGYSLIVIITAEFSPINIGFGFTLNGVGGLLGLHRTMDTERLRTGIRDNAIQNVLFPQNVVDNAMSIISSVEQFFPAKKDRFVIGPMAKIGWGTPTLITIDIGIIIELPSPIILAILGVVKAAIPSDTNAILKIQVNFVGIIDFDKKYILFDATLFDSYILTFKLVGDMMLRIFWGDQKGFVLSVGGFHPKFKPPPLNLPANPQRLSLILADSNNLKIRVETYFAVTSNSVQFGAKVFAQAIAGKADVIGAIWFDILFQFKPFYFIANMGAMFAVRWKGKDKLSAHVELTFEGPNPWKAQGEARFKILKINFSVSFNKTFGQARVEAIEAVSIDPKMTEALQHKDNWTVVGKESQHQMVTFKELPAATLSDLVVDPFGALSFNQKLLPLNTNLQKFGSSAINDFKRYEIDPLGVTSGSITLPALPTEDYFIRNEFFQMTEDEKLSKPSFEKFKSGIAIGSTDVLRSSYCVSKAVGHEVIIIDNIHRRRLSNPELLVAAEFERQIFSNYVSQSGISSTKNGGGLNAPRKAEVKQETYAVVNKNDFSVDKMDLLNLDEAEMYLAEMFTTNPTLASELIVVNGFEI